MLLLYYYYLTVIVIITIIISLLIFLFVFLHARYKESHCVAQEELTVLVPSGLHELECEYIIIIITTDLCLHKANRLLNRLIRSTTNPYFVFGCSLCLLIV